MFGISEQSFGAIREAERVDTSRRLRAQSFESRKSTAAHARLLLELIPPMHATPPLSPRNHRARTSRLTLPSLTKSKSRSSPSTLSRDVVAQINGEKLGETERWKARKLTERQEKARREREEIERQEALQAEIQAKLQTGRFTRPHTAEASNAETMNEAKAQSKDKIKNAEMQNSGAQQLLDDSGRAPRSDYTRGRKVRTSAAGA